MSYCTQWCRRRSPSGPSPGRRSGAASRSSTTRPSQFGHRRTAGSSSSSSPLLSYGDGHLDPSLERRRGRPAVDEDAARAIPPSRSGATPATSATPALSSTAVAPGRPRHPAPRGRCARTPGVAPGLPSRHARSRAPPDRAVLADLAAEDVEDQRRARGGQLVDAVLAAEELRAFRGGRGPRPSTGASAHPRRRRSAPPGEPDS